MEYILDITQKIITRYKIWKTKKQHLINLKQNIPTKKKHKRTKKR